MIQAGPEISVFRLPLDVAGDWTLTQRVGYFHLWQFENTDGSVSLDGIVNVVFGTTGGDDDAVPMGYNSRVQMNQTVDRVRLTWEAQAGRVAVVVCGPSAQAMEANNIPARQIVFQGQARSMIVQNIVVLNTVTTIVNTETNRARIIFQALITNTAPIYLGPSGVTVATGLCLEPGQVFVGLSNAPYRAIAPITGQNLRVMRELS
jgi:hypothetical protein